MQNSLQRGPPVLMDADNFVLSFAVSILVDKVVLPLLFPNQLFWLKKEEILLCFLFELIATFLALVVGSISSSLGLPPLKEFQMKTVKLLKELISHRIAHQIDSFLSNLVLDLTIQFFNHIICMFNLQI